MVNRHWHTLSTLICSTSIALVGCSSDEKTTNEPSGPEPTISITSPADGALVVTEPEVDGDDVEIPVELTFEVTNFTLMEPGTCAGAAACGHINVKVDGDACNDTEATGDVLPFNEQAWADEGDADLFYCPGVHFEGALVVGAEGAHTITAELAGDDESPIKFKGTVVSDSIDVTVEVEAGASGAGGAGAGGAGGAGG